MRLVSDAELQAFLDGAEGTLNETRRREVAEAIATDESLRDRIAALEEEGRRVRGILALSTPSTSDLPSLDELKEQAEIREAPVAVKRSWLPLGGAWAATIVMALALGWWTGREFQEPLGSSSAAGRVDPVPGEPSPSVARERAATPSAARADESAPTMGELRGGYSENAESDSETKSLFLPGLRVVAVDFEYVGDTSVLRIAQALPAGDTIQLRYFGMLEEGFGLKGREGSPPLALPPGLGATTLRAGWSQVAMRQGGYLLVARAPISEREIRALLMTLP